MEKQLRQWMSRLLAVLLLTAGMAFQSFAANARIAFSDPSAQAGQEVRVTMKFSSTDGQLLGDTKVTLNYDATMLEYLDATGTVSGGNGILQVRGGSGTTEVVTELRFRALRAGTANITVGDWEGYDNNGQTLADVRTGSSAITIQGLETSSEDATLQSLQISPGTLEPAFTPGVENYTASVSLDTASLAVSAIPNNERATVALEGDSGLQEGENTVICRVTAEDGTTVKTYTILVTKTEGGENGGETTVPEQAPEVLAELSSLAKKVQIIALSGDVTVPEGLKESEITIGSAKVIGWVPEGEEDPPYCVFYGINESGEADFYRFDRQDKTLQRYFDDGEKINPELLEAGEKYNELVDDYNQLKWIAIGGGGALLVLVLILFILLIAARRSRDSYGRLASRRENETDSRTPSRQGTGNRRLSKEERYMIGEEEDFEEEDYEDDYYEDELPPEAYQPEPAESELRPEATGEAPKPERRRQQAEEPAAAMPVRKRPAVPVVNMEKAFGSSMAREAAALEETESKSGEETDDFEFFDLDE